MNEWDYIIVGGGPSGLAFAQTVNSDSDSRSTRKRILILEADSILGGAHAVKRVNGYFTEHGPRVYSDRFKSFGNLLVDMRTSFDKLFVKSSRNNSVWYFAKKFQLHELFALILNGILFFIIPNWGKCISVYKFCKTWNFSKESIDFINQICKGTDGADIYKYPLNTFFQLVTQHIGHSFYHPRYPNDSSLFKIWKAHLKSRGVKFDFGTKITLVEQRRNQILLTSNNANVYKCKKVIFAIPPIELQKILINSGLPRIKPSYLNDTRYIPYQSITFHWSKKWEFKKKTKNPTGVATETDWHLVYVVLSESMLMDAAQSGSLISIAITKFDMLGKTRKKLPRNCTNTELFDEVYHQLSSVIHLPGKPDKALIGNLYRPAFVKTSNSGYLKYDTFGDNVLTLGTHNGNSNYPFTTIESAVENGIHLANVLEPESKKFRDSGINLTSIIRVVLLCILILYLLNF